MNKAMMVTLVALFSLGAANAGTIKPNPGFDRVGTTAGEKSLASRSARPIAAPDVMAAPGESRRADSADYPERKREMARRLLWLMLSAR